MKKLLSLLLTLALCIGLMPAMAVPVHAATATVNVAVTDVADGEMIEGAILQIYKQSDTETVLWVWPRGGASGYRLGDRCGICFT